MSNFNFTHAPVSDRPSELSAKVAAVIAQLPQDAPYIEPTHIAPLLGIKPQAMRYHCRNCKTLRSWKGQYRFMMDDPGHVEVLKSLIKLVLWSGRQLPTELKPSKMRVH